MSRGLPEYNQLMRYTINDVCNWLAENKFGEFVRQFRENGIDGNRFVTLTDLDMTKMACQMNKRKDLLKLIRDLPKPAESRVKNIVQPSVPATPTKDYNANRGRAPAPIPVSSPPQNGVTAQDDDYGSDSGPEDDYQWAQSDFSEVSSSEEEDYENAQEQVPPHRQQQPDEDDSDSVGSYEEPDPQQSLPPPAVPRRGAAQVPQPGPTRPTNQGLPMNRRHVPPVPVEEQPAYEETSNENEQQVYDETMEQPVYADPEEQEAPKPVKKTGRKQLPIPDADVKTSSLPRKGMPPTPMRLTSEPEVPAPPPPRGQKGKKVQEPSVPAPPPPRGGRKAQKAPPPVVPQEPDDVYEDPDNSAPPTKGGQLKPPPQDDFEQEDYIEPNAAISMISIGGRRSPIPPIPQPHEEIDIQEEFYEDPDAKPVVQSQPAVHSTVRNSALPPLPNRSGHPTPKPQPVEQEVYEDPDQTPQPPPSRTPKKTTQPTSHMPPKIPHNTKKAPPPLPEEFEQLEYEVPEELMKGEPEMPVSDYMEMQQRPEEKKPVEKKSEAKGQKLPPRPGKNRQLPDVPQADRSIPQLPDNTKKQGNKSNRPLPQPVDNTPSLEDQPWYHGDIERQPADNKLTRIGTNGCYLIRRSKKGGETKPYTLAIFYDGQVFNLNIRKKDNSKYALGMAKVGEQEFSELSELVSFFNSHRLILAKGQTRLKKPCPK